MGDAPTLSYVGIRGDEDREGYMSKKANIQAIFPFRRNIWSEDVIRLVLDNERMEHVVDLYATELSGSKLEVLIPSAAQAHRADRERPHGQCPAANRETQSLVGARRGAFQSSGIPVLEGHRIAA